METLAAFLTFSVTLAAALPALVALDGVRAEAGRHADAWQLERRARACGRIAAAERNVTDAATVLAALHPEAGATTRREAAALARELRALAEPGDAPDDDGRCRISSGGAVFAMALRRQRHAGQPAVWPNWVARPVDGD